MIKRITAVLLCLLIAAMCLSAFADPLLLKEDLSGEERIPLREGSESPAYLYAYAYPQVDESDPSAGLINQFYIYKATDALDFEVPMMVDFYAASGTEKDVTVRISYEITCNNDDFFAILLKTEGDDYVTYAGHTFSRKDIRPGSSVALPYLLGILASEENDEWLQDRQTAKADAMVRAMVWEKLQEESEQIGLYEDFTEEILELGFFPEEDFYLDGTGNPVFYLEPGVAADPEAGLLTFPISIEEILDEI